MPVTLIAPAVLAVVLFVAGVAKMLHPPTAAGEARSLGAPEWMSQPWVEKAHPPAEIVLGLLLAVSSGILFRVAALAAFALFAVYLGLVISAVRRQRDARCNCFGGRGNERVTSATIWRNAWFLFLAVVMVVAAWSNHSVREWVLTGTGGIPLTAAAAGALTVWLILRRPEGNDAILSTSAAQDGADDYIRMRTPAVPVTMADGSETTLRSLSGLKAQLILAVSETCGSCQGTIASVPEWRRQMPQLDIRLLLIGAPGQSSLTSLDEPQTLHDTRRWIIESLDLGGTPSAVLLGADGQLAGGPVLGVDAVDLFVEEIRSTLAEAAHAD